MSEKTAEKTKGFAVHDRRWWLQDESLVENAGVEPELKKPSYVEELESRLREKDQTLKEYIQAHKSSVSDMDDTRKRLEKEVDRRVQVHLATMLNPILDILDNLQRLYEAFQTGQDPKELGKGILLVQKQVEDQLNKSGVERISTEQQKFDPKLMEALMTTEVDEHQADQVLEEFRAGYRLGEQLIRPAGVRVGISKRE